MTQQKQLNFPAMHSRIETELRRQGMDFKTLADISNVSYDTIRRLRTAVGANIVTLDLICQALGKPLVWLIEYK